MPPKFRPTRQRKHKVLARQNGSGHHSDNVITTGDNDVANTQIITESKAVRERRRQQLRDELREQQRKPHISAQKQKRLDKYIENKLKKEENLDLVKKLEQEKLKYDARGLQSSKNLKKRPFDHYVQGQVTNDDPFVVEQVIARFKQVKPQHEDDSGDDSEDSFEERHRDAFAENGIADDGDDAAWFKKKATTTSEGTGLAQPLQLGPDGFPIIPTRKGKRNVKTLDDNVLEKQDSAASTEDAVEEPWEGFSSETDVVDGDTDSNHEDDSESLSDASAASDSETDVSDDVSEDSNAESASTIEAPDSDKKNLKTRTSAFKLWATQKVNESLGHTPSYDLSKDTDTQLPSNGIKPAAGYRLGVKNVDAVVSKAAPHVVHIERDTAIHDSRSQLPIIQREQEIMEAVQNHSVIVLKGETGSGKTTQIPQFLYEAGYGDSSGPNPGLIGVTQPRRVAAVSMAKRVAEELGVHGSRVAHQIRFDTTVSSNTAIKFMTDGVLLRELSQDLLLKKYSVIVIDEAHERSTNTDILIGMLSKIVPARMKKTAYNPDPKPLKLIIMSATLNIGDFLHDKIFDHAHKPPVVEAEGRQHRVTTHFALRSRPDYVEETIEKVKRAHRKLPRGGMLVFLTGQNEIKLVLARLRKELQNSSTAVEATPRMHVSAADAPLETEDLDIGIAAQHPPEDNFEDDIDILTDEEVAEKEFEISDGEDVEEENNATQKLISSEELLSGESRRASKDPYDTVHILPLYSQLPTKEQLRVFEPTPDRARLIVLATNVAETSLTIPGIRYVFDCGRSKERNYNVETNVQSFEIDYISKASAQQRAGRAGRTGPGHCWRLYSSAVYEQYFPEHMVPEILRTPAESIVLQLKSFKYPKPVTEFPFPSAPSVSVLQRAEKLLRNLGALQGQTVTTIGTSLSTYPISPRLGKILVSAIEQPQNLQEAILLVSVLSMDDIFINDAQISFKSDVEAEDSDPDSRKQRFGRIQAALSKNDKSSDVLKMYTAMALYSSQSESDRDAFCADHHLRPKALLEAYHLSVQLRRLIQASNPGILQNTPPAKSSLKSAQSKHLNAFACSGFTDQIAIRHDLHPTPPLLDRKPRRVIDVPYLPLTPLTSNVTNTTPITDRAVFIHPTSVLSRLTISALPPFIIYRQLQRSQPATIADTDTHPQPAKTRMLPLAPVHSAKDLLELVKSTALLQYGKPVPKTQVEELPGKPKKRVCWVSCEVRDRDASTDKFVGTRWPLPPVRVRQIMDIKNPSGWTVEEILA